jgi:putative nucleotidyltransferase with HDIG domain
MIGEERGARIERIPLARVKNRSLPVRAPGTEAEIQALAASIRKHGLLHPILVRPAGRDYEVVCGQRRLQAVRAAGHGEIVAVVRTVDDRQAFELSVAENARRGGWTASERDALLRRLQAMFPGRGTGELESWLGTSAAAEGAAPASTSEPAEAPPVAAPEGLEDWLVTLPETSPAEADVSVMVAGDPGGGGDTAVRPAPAPVAVSSGGAGETRVWVSPGGGGAPKVVVKRTLLWKVKTLLNRLIKGGNLDAALLNSIVDDLVHKAETLPAPDFLDLTVRRTKRYVSQHCLNVAKLAIFLGRSLGMPPEEIRDLAVCGLLHDVGMMKVKQDVFTKHAALDQAEWEQVKGHPVEGALLLTKEVVLRDVVARVALEHHEKPDGTGYPEGKKKNEIHVYARIINVVDTYGAMVSPRAHRLPMLPFQAMRVVMDDGAKGMLDWELVQSFVRAMSMYPLGSYVKLEGGEVARVVRAQPELPDKPVISVVADAQRNILKTPVEIDLAMTEPMPAFEPVAAPF